jgi:hypothetical protein
MMNQRRILDHLCAATAFACATHASAQLIAWSDCNLVVPATIGGIYINVETQNVGSSAGGVAGWDLNPYSSTGLTWFNAPGTGMMRYPGFTSGSAGSFGGAGITVGGAGVENSGYPTSFGSGSVVVGTAPGNWRLNDTNYFGFRFVASDGLVRYGWGTFRIGASIGVRTITNIYYEATPGAPCCVALYCIPCPTDINDDHRTDGADLSELLAVWGPCGQACREDLDQSGSVDGADLSILLASWGGCPCPNPTGCW